MSSIHRRHSRCPQVMRGRASGIRTHSYLVRSTEYSACLLYCPEAGSQAGTVLRGCLRISVRGQAVWLEMCSKSRLISFIGQLVEAPFIRHQIPSSTPIHRPLLSPSNEERERSLGRALGDLKRHSASSHHLFCLLPTIVSWSRWKR